MPDALLDFDVADVVAKVVKLLIAYAIVFPIGLQREKAERTAGLRTFPLVSMAACGFALIGAGLLENDPSSGGRVVAGIVTGMGFIGGGAILKDADRVKGTATAASLWTAGAIGAACGFGQFTVALLLGLINVLTLLMTPPLKREISGD